MMEIRLAGIEDLEPITEIYNDAIINTIATFDKEPKSIAEQRIWFESHGDEYPIVVGELDKKIIGWAALSPYSARCAYSATAEVSVYIREDKRGQGFGRAMLEHILKLGHKKKFHVLIARIAGGNENSIHLFESVGFTHVGVMREVGQKFGRLLDVYIMQMIMP